MWLRCRQIGDPMTRMEPETERKPWAFIAHKGSHLGGVTAADKDSAKFLAPFIRKGYAVLTVYDREEYLAAIKSRDFGNDTGAKP